MNHALTTLPPVTTASQAAAPAMVGLHIGDALLNLFLVGTVPQNHALAAWLLARVLTLQLRQDLLIEDGEDVIIFGTLADAAAYVNTRDTRQTIATIKAELLKFGLLQISQIGIGHIGGPWQCVHPGPQMDMAPLMNLDRFGEFHKRMAAESESTLAALKKLIVRPPGDHPPGPLDPPAPK